MSRVTCEARNCFKQATIYGYTYGWFCEEHFMALDIINHKCEIEQCHKKADLFHKRHGYLCNYCMDCILQPKSVDSDN